MLKNILTLLVFAISFSLNAQFIALPAIPDVEYDDRSELTDIFSNYSVYHIDVNRLDNHLRSNDLHSQVLLEMGSSGQLEFSLDYHALFKNDFQLQIAEEDGIKLKSEIKKTTFRGHTKNGNLVGLTIDRDYLYGSIQMKEGDIFIEPLYYFIPDAPKDLFIIYSERNVLPVKGKTCGFDESQERAKELIPNNFEEDATRMACYDVTVNLAADWAMRVKHGSTTNVLNHITGVLNNVATNYDNEFNHTLNLVVGATFLVNCSTCDPWTSSTNAGTLLASFRTWGNGGGFSSAGDVATLWTNRNLAGSTIGIAYLNGLCNSVAYNVCQDFTSSATFLRVLQAHEFGHNFSSGHDAAGSPWIMAPAVQNTNSWSTASENSINNYVSNRISAGCFSACNSGTPPVAEFSGSHTNPICPGTAVGFTDLSTGTPTSWQWSFPGGTPSTSSAQNPGIIYNNPGTYNVTLTVTNSAGTDTELKTNYVVVSNFPIPSFTYTAVDNVVTFNNTSQHGNSYSWLFGDGGSSNQTNPVHTYPYLNAAYKCRLIVTNACGVREIALKVVVTVTNSSPPTAQFTSNHNNPVCAGNIVSFTDLSTSSPTSWSWSFPGGTPSTSTLQNPTVSYPNPGAYNVTLTVSNAFGSDTETKTNYVQVVGNPISGFNYSKNQNVVSFMNTSSGATSYLWNFGDGTTSTQVSPVHTYSNSGTYSVTLVASSNCGSNTSSQSISVTVPSGPTADFTGNHNNPICEGTVVNYTDLSTGNPTSWSWSFPGGTPSSSTAQNPSVTYNNRGNYNVTLTVTNSSGSDTETKNNYVRVISAPVADFIAGINNATVFFNNVSQGGASSFFWDFGDGNTSIQNSPTHTYANSGTYTVVLTATNGCGSSNKTLVLNITVPQSLSADFSSNHTNPICAPHTVSFQDMSVGNPTSWSWSFPGGSPSSSSAQNPVITYNSIGDYNVTLTVSNGNGSNTTTKTKYVVVQNGPVANFDVFQFNGTAYFVNNSTGATNYFWDFGDGTTSTAFFPVHQYTQSGFYTITLTAYSACGSDVMQRQLAVFVSTLTWDGPIQTTTPVEIDKQSLEYEVSTIEEVDLQEARIIPNPASSTFRVAFEGASAEKISISMFSLQGSRILIKNEVSFINDTSELIDISALPAGMYLIRISSGSKSKVEKLIIE